MTQEEKAKAYDEAIERANNILEGKCKNVFIYDNYNRTMIDYLLSELKESEDEKMREMAIKAVYAPEAQSCIKSWGINPDDVIAWLEKQGELSIFNTPSREIILAIWDLGNEWKELTDGCISTEHGTQLAYIQKHWQESEYYLRAKQGKHKPADKIEPKFRVGQTIKKEGFNLGFPIVKIENGFYYNDMGDYFPFTDQDNWELVEQRPAWSEEDNIMANDIDYALRCQISYPKSRLDSMSSWIYNLKNRVQPQLRQEWSEEDEKEVAVLEAYIRSRDWSERHIDRALGIVDELVKKLKSIRPQTLEAVEYTRTDAFIEKACSWLKNHYRDYMHNPTGKRLEAFFGGDMCNDFENYMREM